MLPLVAPTHSRIRRTRFVQGVLVGLGLACLGATGVIAAGKPVVVTANTILADITRQIAGDAADVHCLVPTGFDLHGFEPKPSDVAVLARATLVVVNGAGAEPWLDKLVANSGFSGPVVAASAGCTLVPRVDDHDDHGHEEVDPHAWQDVRNGIQYVANIREALGRIDPANAVAYRQNATRYTAELTTLDTWIRERFATLPPERRRIVTSHDALAYFGRAYALEITPVRGLAPQQEPDARQIARLVDELRAQKIRAIFVEAVSNPKMLEQLARDTGATLGGELFTDSVGPPGSPAGTYAGMLRTNAGTILRALERE